MVGCTKKELGGGAQLHYNLNGKDYFEMKEKGGLMYRESWEEERSYFMI